MKILYSIVLLAVAYCNVAVAQSGKIFEIVRNDHAKRKSAKDFKSVTSNFFEDEHYVVRKTCSGEWGGSIFFKNKVTGKEYVCSATCPVVVNKIDGKYIVTNTLAHLSGFSEVIQIDMPDSMQVYEPLLPQKKNGQIMQSPGNAESRSIKGRKQLLAANRVLIMTSFPYEGQLYHITTDFQKTYVSKIEDDKLVHLDLVSDGSIWTYDPSVIKTKDDHYIVFFNNKKAVGYLDIFGNKIGL